MELQQIKGFLDTPLLWDGKLFGIEQFVFISADIRNFKFKPIPQNIRLGHQVEHIFQQLLVESKNYEILLFNQPIKNEDRTIGEIDFIVRDNYTQEITHIELTYKFYLIEITICEKVHQLIGPNKIDNFYNKIKKIKQQQFKLIQSKEAIYHLEAKLIKSKNILSKVVFKAQLFFPYNFEKIDILPFNAKAICGFWLQLKDFDTAAFHQNLYYLPTKKEWIITPHKNVAWKNFKETLSIIKEQHTRKNSPMLWMQKSSPELDKFFVIWW